MTPSPSTAVSPDPARQQPLSCDSSNNNEELHNHNNNEDHHHPPKATGVLKEEDNNTHHLTHNDIPATATATAYHSDDDQSGNILERDYTGMFEGPEKTLEVVFRRVSDDHVEFNMGELSGMPNSSSCTGIGGSSCTCTFCLVRVGLRRLTKNDVDRICERARCTILSSVSNRYLDAYVLSESSLFIYPYMLVLKTCGTTTLLRCIGTLIDLARKLGLEIDWLGYSRKNFNFPGDQSFPHQSFYQELDYLYGHRNLCERLDGNGYTLGPVTGDHWFVFVADHTIRTKALEMDTDRVLNIMMFDIDVNVAQFFEYNTYDKIDGETKDEEAKRISIAQTVESGIKDLCPGALIDARSFEPCGYSMNAILFRSYSTIHITPESGSSYASFETNQKVKSYKSLISNVIRTFRPQRFIMTLMADEGGLKRVQDNPLADSAAESKIVVPASKNKTTEATTNSNKQTGNAAAAGAAAPKQQQQQRPRTSAAVKQSLTYKRQSLASIKVEDDCCCMMGNWVLEETKCRPNNVDEGLSRDKPRGMTIS